MTDDFFAAAETAPLGFAAAADEVLASLRFDRDGLIPVIAQCARSGETLMLAWMSRESLALTMRSGRMTYWSRSRRALWEKGETSGCRQTLRRLRVDCDGDCLLAEVEQQGAACHSGRRSCFYVEWRGESFVVSAAPANKEGRALGDSNL